MLINKGDSRVDDNLVRMKEHYGKDYLESLEDREFYQLYKEFTATKSIGTTAAWVLYIISWNQWNCLSLSNWKYSNRIT